ncbi:hypothetical protein WJX73_008953 [Symbiochloris irregularis]|uniref:F-box domain-containing protein n=1 Tax=Symbiochloris irregularis TaxID=706552 RepID=A0AAW1NI76_9CHLO
MRTCLGTVRPFERMPLLELPAGLQARVLAQLDATDLALLACTSQSLKRLTYDLPDSSWAAAAKRIVPRPYPLPHPATRKRIQRALRACAYAKRVVECWYNHPPASPSPQSEDHSEDLAQLCETTSLDDSPGGQNLAWVAESATLYAFGRTLSAVSPFRRQPAHPICVPKCTASA